MSGFYALVKLIQNGIESLNKSTKEIEQINDQVLFKGSKLRADDELQMSKKVRQLVHDANEGAQTTCESLLTLKKEAKRIASSSSSSEVSSDDDEKDEQSKKSASKADKSKSQEDLDQESHDLDDRQKLCETVKRSFLDELLLYQSAQQDFRNEWKERLTKQIQMVKPNSSQDEIDISLRSEGGRDALYKTISQTSGTKGDAKKVYHQVAEKYHTVKALDESIALTNQVFLRASKAPVEEEEEEEKEDKPNQSSKLQSQYLPRERRRFSKWGKTARNPSAKKSKPSFGWLRLVVVASVMLAFIISLVFIA